MRRIFCFRRRRFGGRRRTTLCCIREMGSSGASLPVHLARGQGPKRARKNDSFCGRGCADEVELRRSRAGKACRGRVRSKTAGGVGPPGATLLRRDVRSRGVRSAFQPAFGLSGGSSVQQRKPDRQRRSVESGHDEPPVMQKEGFVVLFAGMQLRAVAPVAQERMAERRAVRAYLIPRSF